jgi:flagellar motor switch protein FliM
MPETISQRAVAQPSAKVSTCNFRQSERLATAHVRSVTALNENFARNLARALAAYLRVSMECALVSVEQVPYREFLSRVPELSYVATVVASTDQSSALMQMDLEVAFPIIDLLLGGEGKPEPKLRELTEIEEQVLEGVVRILCHELTPAWQPLGVSFEFQQREQFANLNKLMAPEERTLAVAFEITMPELRGKMNLVFPGLLSNTLIRRLARDWEYQRPRPASGTGRMRELVMDCEFNLELSFRDLIVPAAELSNMVIGQVLPLRRPVENAATAIVGDVPMFTGRAARNGVKRAAQIVAVMPELNAGSHCERRITEQQH